MFEIHKHGGKGTVDKASVSSVADAQHFHSIHIIINRYRTNVFQNLDNNTTWEKNPTKHHMTAIGTFY